jgi:AcrR family transcriptional regulator
MVASSAGCNVALISYYFGGKQGLYEELLTRHFSRVRLEFERFVSNPKYTDVYLAREWPEFAGTGTKAKRIRRFTALLLELSTSLTSSPDMSRILWRELIAGGKTAVRALSKAESGAIPLLLRELEQLKREGHLKKELENGYAVVSLAGPVIYSMMAWPVLKSSLGFKQLDGSFLRSLVLHLTRSLFEGWGDGKDSH